MECITKSIGKFDIILIKYWRLYNLFCFIRFFFPIQLQHVQITNKKYGDQWLWFCKLLNGATFTSHNKQLLLYLYNVIISDFFWLYVVFYRHIKKKLIFFTIDRKLLLYPCEFTNKKPILFPNELLYDDLPPFSV